MNASGKNYHNPQQTGLRSGLIRMLLRSLRSGAYLLLCLTIAGCVSDSSTLHGHRDSTIARSEAELEVLRAEALNGSGSAAYEISMHFEFALRKPDVGLEWLKIAALLGDERAQKALAMKEKSGEKH